jgi:hypothetical protein
MSDAKKSTVFKTAWFSKAAHKAHIKDTELCEDIQAIIRRQAVDLGGGVFKKRLNRNMHRSIVLRAGGHWFYVYLFARSDRNNIENDELTDFRKLADAYARITNAVLA